MRKTIIAAAIALAILGCKEMGAEEPAQFSFIVYPGARYLGPLTDLIKRAHRVIKPNEEAPPTQAFDTDAPVEDVANFYAKSYGYGTVAPDATNNLSSAKPPAYWRTGDLATDNKPIEPLLQKMHVAADVSKAVGTYKAAEIDARPNRPRVTVQRPYFDTTSSQVVDRTLILMSK